MHGAVRLSLVTAVAILGTGAAPAQKTTDIGSPGALSPHVRTEWTVGGAHISIEYGRPYLKGRTPGKDVDPYEGREWRTGADKATTFRTDGPLKFGDLAVPPDSYTLYTIPINGVWHLIVSKRTGQWGIPYPGAAHDLGRVQMTMGQAEPPSEQLTFLIERRRGGGTLQIRWGSTSASIPVTVG